MTRSPVSSHAIKRVALRAFRNTKDSTAPQHQFGQIALRERYVTNQQLAACLRIQKQLMKNRKEAPLGIIMLQEGLLSTDQFLRILELQKKTNTGGSTKRRTTASEKRLGKYTLLRRVGSGGMGIVYEARDPDLNRHVAIKTLRDSEDSSEDRWARLEREGAIIAQLQHPNIVPVHEIGAERDKAQMLVRFIVMEYINGRTFEEVLSDKKVSDATRLRILEKIARAVGFAHEKGVIHRDLKPANILVEKGGRPLLTDFGLAWAARFNTRLTRTHEVLGTPIYMAPEQIQGRWKEIDHRTDVYALGVILYQILTGGLPFRSNAPGKLFEEITHREPIPPSQRRRGTALELEAICLKAMDKNPERRYADASEFSRDLMRFRLGEQVEARKPSVWYRLTKTVGRRIPLVRAIAGTALFLLFTGSAVIAQLQSDSRAELDKQRAESKQESRKELDRERAISSHRLSIAKLRVQIWEQEIKPLAAVLEQTQGLFYAPRYDIRLQLAEVEKALRELQSMTAEPALAGYLEIWKMLGRGWHLVGDNAQAEQALRRARSLSPKDPQVNFALGKILLHRAMQACANTRMGTRWNRYQIARKLNEEAVQCLDQAEYPSDGEREFLTHVARAYRALAEGNKTKLARLCREGLRRFRGRLGVEEYWILLAWFATAKEGLIACTQALSIRPHYPWAYIARAGMHVRMGNGQAAIDDYSAAIRIFPRYADAYCDRGIVRSTLGQWDRALRDLNEALRLNPTDIVALASRGELRLTRGNFAGAKADLQRSRKLAPRDWNQLPRIEKNLRRIQSKQRG